MSPARLSVPDLVEEAATRAGSPARDVPFLANLQRLVASSEATGRLNDAGRQVLRSVVLRHLRNVLEVRAYVESHPEVALRPLTSPVVVTGLPRTGTTLLHNLLALDPGYRFLRFWEALHPIPADAGGEPPDAQVARAERWLDAFYRMVPDFRAIHPATATGPEECDALLQNTFASQHFDDMFDASDYSEWFAHASLTQEYEHYALQLRVLSTHSGGASWALKSPSHLGHLDALLTVLPGCAVVFCHRHPSESVASYASLVHTLRRAYSDDVSAQEVGVEALRRAATAMGRALAVRDAEGEAAVIDVAYRELVEDPVGTVAGLYRRLGRSLLPEVEGAMRHWVSGHPAARHGPHRYDLARFGLSEADVQGAFTPYLERFGALVDAR